MFFTIITINKNNAEGLKKTIKSVSLQIFKDFEYIIVDGNSRDYSQQIIKENINLIDKVVIENDSGVYHAMNKGIQLTSNSEYTVFLNSGDYFFDETTLKQLFEILNSATYKPILVLGGYIRNSRSSYLSKIRQDTYCPPKKETELWKGMLTSHQATYFRTKILDRYNFLTNHIAADYIHIFYIISEAKQCSKKILLIDHPVCVYEGGGLSAKNFLSSLLDVYFFLSSNSNLNLKQHIYHWLKILYALFLRISL